LARFDAVGDRSRTRTMRVGVGAAVATFITGFICLFTQAELVFAAFPAGAAALGIGAAIRHRRLKRRDLSNNLGTVVVPLLNVFREDVDPKKPLVLDLDLRRADLPEKLLREDPAYGMGPYHKVIDRHYQDGWMTGRAAFADGARLGWSVVDQICERRKTKRNPRGKYKTKTQYRKRSVVTVTLSLPTDAYAIATPKVAGDANRLRVRVSNTGDTNGENGWRVIKLARTFKARSLEPMDPVHLLDLVAEGYRLVSATNSGKMSAR